MQKESRNTVKIYYPRYNREKLISYLKSKVNILQREIDLKLMVLFGSYAKNRFTVASDIDLLIVYGEVSGDAYKIAWDIIDIPNLQLFTYSLEEYAKLKNRTNFIDTVLNEGVIIYRSQDFKI